MKYTFRITSKITKSARQRLNRRCARTLEFDNCSDANPMRIGRNEYAPRLSVDEVGDGWDGYSGKSLKLHLVHKSARRAMVIAGTTFDYDVL